MKAVVHRGLGGQELLAYRNVPDPVPDPGEVVVHLKTAGLNHRDLFVMKDRAHPEREWIPGSDGAGIVEAVGAGVENVRPGDRVVIHPTLGWERADEIPEVPAILGGPSAGTFAELVAVPAANVFAKPDFLTWEEAGVLPLSALTAYRALFGRGRLKPEESLLVTGIGGGVATYALMMAKAAGASVAVTSRSADKLRKALALGADLALDNAADWASVPGMRKADLILDSVGGALFPRFFALLNPGGRIVSLGASSDARIELSLRELFFSQFGLIGTSMGSREEFIEMLHFVETHRIRPVVDSVRPLSDAASAFDRLVSGSQFGNLAIRISD
ncbi:alcohol dehydrogenase [Saccharibacillus sp. O23]|uniref:zinc-binding dehydrogenase n=1 Tax=Saccharibacillus sp. O23 TaxID=2009338 RepID=UPI000B4E6C84|nr:zinc-binding dehydrogenase [Saccharibacillus sp. O23]OWR27234.1 alcohol dehydrogenase [Saccharibacillus sp. O23]